MKTISVMAAFCQPNPQHCLPPSHSRVAKLKRKKIFSKYRRGSRASSWSRGVFFFCSKAISAAVGEGGRRERKTLRAFVKKKKKKDLSAVRASSHGCEKPFEVWVFSGSPTLPGLEWERGARVCVGGLRRDAGMRDGGRFTMATGRAALGAESEPQPQQPQ